MSPLTLDQLSDLVEDLQKDLVDTQKKVGLLEVEVKQYQQDILELEQQLAQSITTQKLIVLDDAQIVNRNVEQTFSTFEQRLNSHDTILSTHDTNIAAAQGTANDAVARANNAQGTANDAGTKADAAQKTANDAVARANNAQGTANSAVTKADAAQKTANSKIQDTRIGIYGGGQSAGSLPGGWVRIDGDLNAGAGGKFIYLEIKR